MKKIDEINHKLEDLTMKRAYLDRENVEVEKVSESSEEVNQPIVDQPDSDDDSEDDQWIEPVEGAVESDYGSEDQVAYVATTEEMMQRLVSKSNHKINLMQMITETGKETGKQAGKRTVVNEALMKELKKADEELKDELTTGIGTKGRGEKTMEQKMRENQRALDLLGALGEEEELSEDDQGWSQEDDSENDSEQYVKQGRKKPPDESISDSRSNSSMTYDEFQEDADESDWR